MSNHLMLTYTNKLFDPLEATLDDIDIRDIAHHLSLMNRYCGATRVPYSVAEHSLHVSALAEQATSWGFKEAARLGLLHDSSEAYLGDICRGLKYRPGVMDVYREAEKVLMDKILRKFNIYRATAEIHQIVHTIDRGICGTEMQQLMSRPLDVNGDKLTKFYPIVVGVMSASEAETRFLARYYELWQGAE